MGIKQTVDYLIAVGGKKLKELGGSKVAKPTQKAAASPPPRPAKTEKRGHYKQKECPYCHIHVGNLGNHINLKHPAERAKVPPVDLTKQDLLGETKKHPADETPAEVKKANQLYYCQDCKAELRQGEETCWHCGAVLNWEGI